MYYGQKKISFYFLILFLFRINFIWIKLFNKKKFNDNEHLYDIEKIRANLF